MEESAALLEFSVELLDVVGGQLVYLYISQRRNDVLVDAAFVRRLGVGPKIGFLVGLIPEIQPIPQEDSRFRLFGSRSLDAVPQCLRACLKSSNEDGNEGKRENLSGNVKFAFTIFPKSAEFVEPAEKTLYHPAAWQNDKLV